MHIASFAEKLNSLTSEVASKAKIIASLDGSTHDAIQEEGDIYVSELPADHGGTITGRVLCAGGTGGMDSYQAVDIEEKNPDRGSARYQMEKKDHGEHSEFTILKKTDTHKLKATVLERPSEPASVVLEETQFVEAALAPEIDSLSEELRKEVRQVAEAVIGADNTALDSESAKGTVNINNATVKIADGKTLEVSGHVMCDPSGILCSAELTGKLPEGGATEYYFVRGSDSDFYKKSAGPRMESAQIFEKDGPKLILYSEELHGKWTH
ncbi:MAG: hypothetical protein RDV48_22155 [Candidatus Eremiobacteraeota bacterium]|nr:hypothetical protein [Candidatus Eremiobacteraeota bacterium]